MTGISDEFIAEAALVAPVGVAAPKKRPFASLSRALNSGWGVACICFIVAIAAVVGMVAWGRMGEAVGPGSDPSVRFAFSYEMTDNNGSAWSGTAMPGDIVNVSTTVVNHGKTFVTDDFFAWARFVLQEDESVVIEGDYPLVESIKHPVKNGDQGTISFHFHIPENATPGVYDLVLSYDGEKQVFGGALTVGDPNAKFSFGYKLAGDALTGASYLMNTWVINEGEPFTFEGSSMGFAPTAVLIHMETQYRIDGSFGRDDDHGVFTVNTGDAGRVTQEFFIPADAPTGAYALQLSYGGVSKSFPGVVIVSDLVLDYPLLENGHPFSFGYQPFGDIANPGDRFIMNAWVINEGEPFSFMGDPYSFQPTATLYHMDSDYTIGGLPPPTGVEPRPCNILTGQKGESAYTFPIPADAPTGVYGLKLTYGGTQETFDNVLTVAVPTVIAPAVLYNLAMPIGSDWLYEPIDEAYVDGEEVTVRIQFATDVGTLFFLNGEVIDAVTGDDQLGYWEYSFIMPQKDSEIIFQTYDGTAPYGDILKAYYIANPTALDVLAIDYGTYGDGVRVAILYDDRFAYTDTGSEQRIGPAVIRYADSNIMQVLHNGVFCSLSKAYEAGLLSDADLAALENLQREWNPHLYADDE